MTDELLAFIRDREKLMLRPYKDAVGLWTVGYGHRCAATQQPITEPEAEAILRADVEEAERHALALCPALTGRRLGALTDLVFNTGAAPLIGSGLVRELNAGDWAEAATRFKAWNKGHVKGRLVELGGLTERRNALAPWIQNGG
jgi:GH24 family phage-related lysozyme (muramidase)